MSKVIYRIRNIITGSFYVGSTSNKKVRFRTHRRQLRSGKSHNFILQKAWDKYGEEAFKFEVVEDVPEETDIFEAEGVWLKEHHGKRHCYNLSKEAGAPDHTGHTHSPEVRAKISKKVQAALAEGRGGHFIPTKKTRKKMSDALKGNTCAKGYKRSDAEREAIRQRTLGNQHWLGKHHSDESRTKMGKPLFELTTGKKFAVMNDAVKFYGMPNLATILRSIKTGNPVSTGPHAGLMFSYTEDTENPLLDSEYPLTRKQAIEQGSKYYFTGKPCKHGHIAPRVTKGVCTVCRKIEWQAENERRKSNSV